MLSLKKLFCRACGIGVWVINGDRTLLTNHLRHVHRIR